MYKLIRINREKEPEAVKNILGRLQSLGAEHPLAPLAVALGESIDTAHQSLSNVEEKESQYQTAFLDQDIARRDLVKQYKANYYNACRDMGKKRAERIFPVLSRSKKTETVNPDVVEQ